MAFVVVVAGLGPVRVIVKPPNPTRFTVTVPESVQFVVQLATVTFSVKVCVAFVPIPLLAVNDKLSVPTVTAVVQERVPVPLPLSWNETPVGNANVSVSDGIGKPVVVTVNEPATPAVALAEVALVIAGAACTVSVKAWVAFEPTPLLAVNDRV
jgi:hypothetical protein